MKTFPKAQLLICAIGLTGILFILVGTSKYGAAISADSSHYICTARNLIEGKGFQTFRQPFVRWPPLFPTLLGLSSLGRFDPFDTSRYVNAICFGLTLFVSGTWLLKNIKSFPLALLGLGLIFFSKPILRISMFVWTEPVFVFLTLLFIFEMSKFLEDGKNSSLALAGTCAALGCLTRYIGVTLILTGLAVILIKQKKPFKQTLFDAFLFALISAIPAGIWLIRNYFVSGTLVGERFPSKYSFLQNIYYTLLTINTWVFTNNMPTNIGIGMLLFLLIIIFVLYRKKVPDCRAHNLKIAPLKYFILIYTSFLITAASLTSFDIIYNRLLSPIYIPLILIIFIFFDNIAINSKRVLSVILSMGCIWLGGTVWEAAKNLKTQLADGAGGYTVRRWKNSALINHLKTNPLEGEIFSNHPPGLYNFANIPSRKYPHRHLSKELTHYLDKNYTNYYVWFKDQSFPEELIKSGLSFEAVITESDGTVFLINSSTGSSTG